MLTIRALFSIIHVGPQTFVSAGTDRQGLFQETLSRWLARNNIQCQPVGPESCQLQLSWTEDRQELFYDRLEVEKLLTDNDIVVLQETWLSKQQEGDLKCINNKCNAVANSPMMMHVV